MTLSERVKCLEKEVYVLQKAKINILNRLEDVENVIGRRNP